MNGVEIFVKNCFLLRRPLREHICLSTPVRSWVPSSANGRRARGDFGPKLGALLGHRSLDGGALHLALVVDDDTGVVLEVDEDALLAAPRLLLSDYDAFQHLLPQLWFPLLHGAQHHVAGAGLRKLVQPAAIATHGDDVEVLRAAVVGAIHERGHAATQRHLQLAPAAPSTSALHGSKRAGDESGLL